MRKEGDARRTEMLRKAVHVGSGLLALLLGVLTWQQALLMALGAFAFNLLVLPRLGGGAMHREHEKARGWAFGILVYPLSVAILIIAFRDRLELAAAGWALMAFGDGMASVIGTLAGKHRLPWNPRKSWEGIAAFVVFGVGAGVPVAALVATMRGSLVPIPMLAGAFIVAAVLTAFAESMDWGIDDNIVVPMLGAGLTWIIADFTFRALDARSEAEVGHAVAIAGSVCVVLAMLAAWRGLLTVGGALAAALLGTIVGTFGGWPAFAALCAFFALGVGATRLGRRVKESRGIAEPRRGRRGLGNVLANGGVAGLLAIAAWSNHGRSRETVLFCLAAALATAAFDTVSSEVGKAYGRRTFLPTTLRRVPPGTEGAVSLEGTSAGLVAAMIVAIPQSLAGPWGGLALTAPRVVFFIVVLALAAFIGSTFESVVGSISQQRGHAIDNDALNFANTVVGAAAMAFLVSVLGLVPSVTHRVLASP